MRGTDRQIDDNVDVSFREREENPGDPAGNQTQDLTIEPLDPWQRKEASLLITARLEASGFEQTYE